MSKPATPIADLVNRMMVNNLSRDIIVSTIRTMEVPLYYSAISSVADAAALNRRRISDKARQKRKRVTSETMSGDTESLHISSSLSFFSDSQESKNLTCGTSDDWPDDYGDLFWAQYPEGRKYDKARVYAKLARLRRDGTVTFATLMGGLASFAGSNPEPRYTPAPLVWLNQARWMAKGVASMQRQKSMSFMDVVRNGGKLNEQS